MYAKTPSQNEVSTSQIDRLLAKILSDIKPTSDEILLATQAADEIIERLRKVLPNDVEIVTAGSLAHGTQLKFHSDIDIFLLFKRSLPASEMEKIGIEAAMKIVHKEKNERYEIKYAEHPYIKLIFDDLNMKADVVPAYKINNIDDKGTSVDRTPLHNNFVNSHLSDKEKDEVRLLKAFLLGNNLYGAEARVEGFAGYLCELLIYHYKSFINTISKFANFSGFIAIDISSNTEYDKDSKEAKVLEKKFGKNFIVIDPTDKNRNVAASVSNETLARFCIFARRFLTYPSEEYFYGARYSDTFARQHLEELGDRFSLDTYIVSARSEDISEDIIWQQLKKFHKSICIELSKSFVGPVFTQCSIVHNTSLMFFAFPRLELGFAKVKGPNVFIKEASENFMEAHKTDIIMLDSENLYAISNSKYKNFKTFIKDIKNMHVTNPSHINLNSIKVYKVKSAPEEYVKAIYVDLLSHIIKFY
ncbi:MAG: CCA tRNA nucleotidyltransferase [Candidatus Micrarchaeia archaeon]